MDLISDIQMGKPVNKASLNRQIHPCKMSKKTICHNLNNWTNSLTN